MHITPNSFDTGNTLFGKPNVFDLGKPNLSPQTNRFIFLTLNNLVLTRPNWRFTPEEYTHSQGYAVVTSFRIEEDGEVLGKVSIDYKGKGYKIIVRNDRIDAKRERGTGYSTEDPAKAELRIRKFFFRLAKDERIEKAHKTASEVIARQARDKSWALNNTRGHFMEWAQDFVNTNTKQYMAEFPKASEWFDKWVDAKAQHAVTETMQTLFDNDKSILVVLDGTQYIVKAEEEIKAYTDETLPYELRGSIGMLKLVQDKQMISDVGCRVDSTTFVLFPVQQDKETA